ELRRRVSEDGGRVATGARLAHPARGLGVLLDLDRVEGGEQGFREVIRVRHRATDPLGKSGPAVPGEFPESAGSFAGCRPSARWASRTERCRDTASKPPAWRSAHPKNTSAIP